MKDRHRPRRLRRGAAIRGLIREHRVSVEQLIAPLFVVGRESSAGEIGTMPGIFRYSVEGALKEAKTLDALGLRSVLLFGIPDFKDGLASRNADPEGVVQRAARSIKTALPDSLVIADLCNCEYTDHGHCGVIGTDGDVDNDATIKILVETALTYADSGVDVIAPSDMMDGRVGEIRDALDEAGHERVAIMAYSAKYSSAFYGPFREAVESTPAFGDRRSYQMDPPNVREALREIQLDLEQGADIVMIKPGMPYLDVVRAARDAFDAPIAVYNVSGEYAMIKAAAANGWIDEERAVDEVLHGFVRAGADAIITYFAKSFAARNASSAR